MILLLILVGGGFFYGLYLGIKDGNKEPSSIGLLFALFGTIPVIIIWFFIALFSETEVRHLEKNKLELIALSNAFSTKGEFFLFSGSIESKTYYFYYYKLPRGGIKLGKVKTNETIVYEEDRTDAYIVRNEDRLFFKHPSWMWMVIPSSFFSVEPDSEFSIFVPKNSIRKEIDLNLKDLK